MSPRRCTCTPSEECGVCADLRGAAHKAAEEAGLARLALGAAEAAWAAQHPRPRLMACNPPGHLLTPFGEWCEAQRQTTAAERAALSAAEAAADTALRAYEVARAGSCLDDDWC